MKLSRHPFFMLFTSAAFLLHAFPVRAADEMLPGAKRILFLGDSITYSGQYVESVEACFVTRFPGRSMEFLNLGLPSETVSGLSEDGHAGGKFPRPDLHERLARVLAKTKPDTVIACYGMNDGIYLPFAGERFAAFSNGLVRLRERVAAAGAKMIHVTPPVFDEARGKGPGYGNVLDRYSDWMLARRGEGWDVADAHGPMSRLLAERRKADPGFFLASDGVHAGEAGHWIMARAILLHLGATDLANTESARDMVRAHPDGEARWKLVQQKQRLLKDAWLTETGHKRPGMAKGLPLVEAQAKAADLTKEILALAHAQGAATTAETKPAGKAVAQEKSGTTNWPQFRGPGALGVAEHPHLPERWSINENLAWQAEVPGRGWSSPIVWGERVFVTTVASEGEVEPARKGLYFGGDRKEIPTVEHRWLVLCYDLKSGRELWRQEAHRGAPSNSLHVKNTYASATPVTDGERVYASFGNVGLFCYDLEGRKLWSTNWPPTKTRNGWGSAASPVLDGSRIFMVNDNDEQSFAVALDAKSGRQIWRVERNEKSNWATPYLWRNDQRTELITPGTKRIRSYDLDGKLLWECGGMSSIVIPTPFSMSGLLYVCSGYVGDKLRPVFAIRPGASGDITLQPGTTNNEFIAWSQPTAGPYNPSPLLYGDYFYVLFDFGFLSCHDAKTGRQIYEKQRIRAGTTSFTASPWAANGKIFALSEDGDTFVFQAGPEYKLLHTNSLDEMCMATPAMAGDRLLIRTLTKLCCFREAK